MVLFLTTALALSSPPAAASFHPFSNRSRAVRAIQCEPSPESGGKRANLVARRRERIRLPDYADGSGRAFPIGEFLRHPSGIESVLNTRALHSFHPLGANTYRCTLHKMQFLKFEVAPVLELRVTPTNEDCIVEMLSCKFEGSETVKNQNNLFSAFMKNHMTWEANGSESYLDVDVDLKITLEVYTKPFSLLPISAVEKPGKLLMQGLIDRLVPLLINQLLRDYSAWLQEQLQTSG